MRLTKLKGHRPGFIPGKQFEIIIEASRRLDTRPSRDPADALLFSLIDSERSSLFGERSAFCGNRICFLDPDKYRKGLFTACSVTPRKVWRDGRHLQSSSVREIFS